MASKKAAKRRGGKSGVTLLMRRPFSAEKEEFAEQDVRAKKAGLSWSSWARQKLSEK